MTHDLNDHDELLRRVGQQMREKINRELLSLAGKILSDSTSTSTSVPAEALTMDKLWEAYKLLESVKPPSIEAIVITKLVPLGGYKIKADGKEYILINVATWKDWARHIPRVEVHSVTVAVSGIPVFESDEKAAQILGKVLVFNHQDLIKDFDFMNPSGTKPDGIIIDDIRGE